MVVNDVRDGKFYWLLPEKEDTDLHHPAISEMPRPVAVFCDYSD